MASSSPLIRHRCCNQFRATSPVTRAHPVVIVALFVPVAVVLIVSHPLRSRSHCPGPRFRVALAFRVLIVFHYRVNDSTLIERENVRRVPFTASERNQHHRAIRRCPTDSSLFPTNGFCPCQRTGFPINRERGGSCCPPAKVYIRQSHCFALLCPRYRGKSELQWLRRDP